MNAVENRSEAVSGKQVRRNTISEFSAGHNLSVPIIVLIMVALGALYWPDSGRDAQATSAAPSQPAAGATAASFDYFPAQYVNQATAIEPHIQAF